MEKPVIEFSEVSLCRCMRSRQWEICSHTPFSLLAWKGSIPEWVAEAPGQEGLLEDVLCCLFSACPFAPLTQGHEMSICTCVLAESSRFASDQLHCEFLHFLTLFNSISYLVMKTVITLQIDGSVANTICCRNRRAWVQIPSTHMQSQVRYMCL